MKVDGRFQVSIVVSLARAKQTVEAKTAASGAVEVGQGNTHQGGKKGRCQEQSQ